MERFRQRYGIALTKKKLQEIILMLMAWEAVFAFSYLGYIELPVVSTTTLHILVIVAAMMLGAEGSACRWYAFLRLRLCGSVPIACPPSTGCFLPLPAVCPLAP